MNTYEENLFITNSLVVLPLGNMTILKAPRGKYCYSYGGLVAAYRCDTGYWETPKFYSKATLKHIDEFKRMVASEGGAL